MRKSTGNYQITKGAIVSWGDSNKNTQLDNLPKIVLVQINSIKKNNNISASIPFDCNKDSCTFDCSCDCRDCSRD